MIDATQSEELSSSLNTFAPELITAIAAAPSPKVPLFTGGGRAAAKAVVDLMRRTVKRLPPRSIVDFYNTHYGRGRSQGLWDEFGKPTAACILDGATTLARIWESAWIEGRGGKNNPPAPTTAFARKALSKLYDDRGFVQSYKLQDITRSGDRLVPR